MAHRNVYEVSVNTHKYPSHLAIKQNKKKTELTHQTHEFRGTAAE